MPKSNQDTPGPQAEAPARDSLVAVDRAVAEIRRGGFVVIVGPDGAGAIVQAAEAVTPISLDRLADLAEAHPSLILTPHRAAALQIPATSQGAVALQLGDGSAAQEVRDIADPAAEISFRLPPARDDASATETACFAAAVHLTKLARLLPAALAAMVPGDGGAVASFAATHDFLSLSTEDIASYERKSARSLKPISQARVPLAGAEDARIVAYRPADGGIEHLAIIIGAPKADRPVLARLHSECFTGDLLSSLRCDCGDQLRGAIEEISNAGAGVLIYLAQEGRGIGLVNKLRAYNLQDEGLDTLDANQQLGFDADERIYLPAAEILRDLGFDRVRLMTNNPEKVAALTRCGIEVTERVSHVFPSNVHNEAYLETKRSRGGHLF
jgi:GTP cyclohydrolase II